MKTCSRTIKKSNPTSLKIDQMCKALVISEFLVKKKKENSFEWKKKKLFLI